MKRLLKIIFRTLLIVFILLNIITAFHAYKFTHFYDASEKPVTQPIQHSGWDILKTVLFGINAYKQNNIAPADSSFTTVYFTTKDKTKLKAWYMKTDSKAIGTVVMFHGHGSKKSAILQEAAGFRKMGYNTLLLDFRAHGSSGGNTSTIGYNETEDVKLAYDFIKAKREKNIVLWGISMGAAAITKAITDYPLQPSKIILEMPYASIRQAAEGRLRKMGLPGEPLGTMITFWGGVENGFWAFNMKPAEFVKNIKCPVLLQWGKNDVRVAKEETDLVYANIPTEKKLVVYETCGHESLCEKENAKWMTEVQGFLSK